MPSFFLRVEHKGVLTAERVVPAIKSSATEDSPLFILRAASYGSRLGQSIVICLRRYVLIFQIEAICSFELFRLCQESSTYSLMKAEQPGPNFQAHLPCESARRMTRTPSACKGCTRNTLTRISCKYISASFSPMTAIKCLCFIFPNPSYKSHPH